MPIGDFLNNVSWDGQSLASMDANLAGGGLTDLNAPAAYAQMLKAMQAPGGLLSNRYQSSALAAQVAGIAAQQRQSEQELKANLAAQGVNPTVAMRMMAEQEQSFNSAALGAANQLEMQRAQNEAEALTGTTNALASLESQQKQLELQDYWNQKFYNQQKKANKFSKIMGIASFALGLPGALNSAAGAIHSLATGGFKDAAAGGGGGGSNFNFNVGASPGGLAPPKLGMTPTQFGATNFTFNSPATVGMGYQYPGYGGYGSYPY